MIAVLIPKKVWTHLFWKIMHSCHFDVFWLRFFPFKGFRKSTDFSTDNGISEGSLFFNFSCSPANPAIPTQRSCPEMGGNNPDCFPFCSPILLTPARYCISEKKKTRQFSSWEIIRPDRKLPDTITGIAQHWRGCINGKTCKSLHFKMV